MKGVNLVLGLGAGLLFAGCSFRDFSSFLFFSSPGPNGEQLVAGSVETVAFSTQGSLRRLGLSAVSTPKGDAIFIESKTRGGSRFQVVLTRHPTAEGEQTHVRLEWLDAPDNQVNLQIMTEISGNGMETRP